ncbi:hypothetical protein HAHE_22920 [Haloferula helveola]|uniref:ThuA-like domain-containing protein n=1 Tax=Haloferula helveola TaxID=490095 RepID=A0ABM7RAG9_9BACT|nr:hypothetical protein HAHE_22920 [Haloferula helveola]
MKIPTFFAAIALATPLAAEDPWLVFEGSDGPGKGKHVVLVSGDEEYRSEEAMPMLGKLLAERHGFKCTVLFAIDPKTGEINPNEQTNIPGVEAIDSADFLVVGLRFRELPDEDMKHIVDYVEAGKPLLGLRTSTHAFKYGRLKDSPYKHWSFNSKEWDGGFGRQVLGETWINHHGHHGKESTRGVLDEANAGHPLLTGVEDVWGTTDVYGIKKLPEDAKVLIHGQVLSTMEPDSAPVEGKKNDPMMPVAWVRDRKVGDKTQKVICTTMGAADDFVHPGLTRFVVNSAFWATGLEVPKELNVEPVGDYKPSAFGFNKFVKGKKPADYR